MKKLSEKYEIQFQSPNPSNRKDDRWFKDDRCPKVSNLKDAMFEFDKNETLKEFRKIGCKFRIVQIVEKEIWADK